MSAMTDPTFCIKKQGRASIVDSLKLNETCSSQLTYRELARPPPCGAKTSLLYLMITFGGLHSKASAGSCDST